MFYRRLYCYQANRCRITPFADLFPYTILLPGIQWLRYYNLYATHLQKFFPHMIPVRELLVMLLLSYHNFRSMYLYFLASCLHCCPSLAYYSLFSRRNPPLCRSFLHLFLCYSLLSPHPLASSFSSFSSASSSLSSSSSPSRYGV